MWERLKKLGLTGGRICSKPLCPIPLRSTAFIRVRKFAELQNNLAELGATFM